MMSLAKKTYLVKSTYRVAVKYSTKLRHITAPLRYRLMHCTKKCSLLPHAKEMLAEWKDEEKLTKINRSPPKNIVYFNCCSHKVCMVQDTTLKWLI